MWWFGAWMGSEEGKGYRSRLEQCIISSLDGIVGERCGWSLAVVIGINRGSWRPNLFFLFFDT